MRRSSLWILTCLAALCCFGQGNENVTVENVGTLQVLVVNGFPAGSLGAEIQSEYLALATNSGVVNTYTPSPSNLPSKTSLWTWPIDLTCVGVGSWGFQTVLISSNLLLANNHYDFCGQTFNSNAFVIFTETNGTITHTNYVQSVFCHGPGGGNNDPMEIVLLQSNVDAHIKPAWVFPENVTNYFVNHAFGGAGIGVIFPHKNTGTVDQRITTGVSPYDNITLGTHTYDSLPFPGSDPTGGDSGTPFLTVLSNKPVLLFALTSPIGNGNWISSAQAWFWMMTNGTSNSLNQINISAFPTY